MSVDDPIVRLRHLRDAIQKAVEFSKDETRTSLDQDEKLALSLVRLIEIAGEAASQINKPFRDNHPQIPWKVLVGMRNRLIHAYFDVDLNIVWETVTQDFPALLVEVEKFLLPEE